MGKMMNLTPKPKCYFIMNPIAPYLAVGLVLLEWRVRLPTEQESVLLGAELANFEGIFHWDPFRNGSCFNGKK
jgi:hypothetical protein